MDEDNPYVSLAWLPRAPAGLPALFAAAANAGEEHAAAAVCGISRHALDDNQLTRLAGVVEALRQRGCMLDPLRSVTVGIAATSTTDLMVPALQGTAPRHGMRLECTCSAYGQAVQSALDPASAVQRSRPQFVLVALDDRWLRDLALASEGDSVEAALGRVRAMLRGFRDGCGATCVVQTIPRPPQHSLLGSFDRRVSCSTHQIFERFNRGLADVARDNAALLVDIATLAENVGLASWHDAALWNLAKVPFAAECLPVYAEWVCRVLAAASGTSRKCLVLDLDNTLWSGVVGDDGIEGILVGAEDPTAEAHLDLQRHALELRARGIVLAVCSKNDDAVARRAFREHPGMLLREEHFAVFQANWEDKAGNLRAIAEHLGLGLDALVFVDDNPAERALIRRELPEVAVPELPEDPALFAGTLAAAGYFESVSFSAEDLTRADAYRDNARRLALRETATNVDDYLRSLRMRIRFASFDEASRPRVAQLINKSNQFNLTTRRYTEARVAEIMSDPEYETLQVRLADAFGDNGMICVVICRRQDDAWDIDTWLMSCRVLGRKVENAVLRELVRRAAGGGALRLTGAYSPSGRNALVQDHYARLGFRLLGQESDGSTRWQLSLPDYAAEELPFTVQAD